MASEKSEIYGRYLDSDEKVFEAVKYWISKSTIDLNNDTFWIPLYEKLFGVQENEKVISANIKGLKLQWINYVDGNLNSICGVKARKKEEFGWRYSLSFKEKLCILSRRLIEIRTLWTPNVSNMSTLDQNIRKNPISQDGANNVVTDTEAVDVHVNMKDPTCYDEGIKDGDTSGCKLNLRTSKKPFVTGKALKSQPQGLPEPVDYKHLPDFNNGREKVRPDGAPLRVPVQEEILYTQLLDESTADNLPWELGLNKIHENWKSKGLKKPESELQKFLRLSEEQEEKDKNFLEEYREEKERKNRRLERVYFLMFSLAPSQKIPAYRLASMIVEKYKAEWPSEHLSTQFVLTRMRRMRSLEKTFDEVQKKHDLQGARLENLRNILQGLRPL